MALFQVERFLPGPGEAGLSDLVARATAACELMTADGVPVRYLRCTFSPDDEMAFCLFEGPSVQAIRDTNRRAGIAFERITTVVDISAKEPTLVHDTTGHRGPR